MARYENCLMEIEALDMPSTRLETVFTSLHALKCNVVQSRVTWKQTVEGPCFQRPLSFADVNIDNLSQN